MDKEIINLPSLTLPKKEDRDPIAVVPTFYGDKYDERSAHLKFNNAIDRMSQPRVVDRTETDVEFVVRNEVGSLYAVVYHYSNDNVESDLLIKKKSGEWSFYRSQIRIHPNFASTYISSIWGYKRLSESQIAQELAQEPAYSSRMMLCDNYVMTALPGGIAIGKCVIRDDEIAAVELLDFVPYETFSREEIVHFYPEMLHQYVSMENLTLEYFPVDLARKTLEERLERFKKKYNK